MKKLFRNHNDIENDYFLDSKTVKLYDTHGNLYSHHLVEKYKVAEGQFKDAEYYLFRFKDGKSIMNYTPEDYYELSGYIDISFKYSIFMKYEVEEYCDSDYDLMIIRISEDYRINQKDRHIDF